MARSSRDVSTPRRSAPSSRRRGYRGRTAWPNDLTDREVDVLRVLARGLGNREIAQALVLSPRTVQHHLASVYEKIGLHTRAGAAVFAIEQGLVPAAPGI
jgi:DNA-binding NarL/FixJ family response regulator